MTTFANNLKHAREFMGWTQAKAAVKLGIKEHNLGAYEEGRSTPNPATFAKIARAMGINDVGFGDNPNFKMTARVLINNSDKTAIECQIRKI